jgi:quercetin dioxygenase-like cupin family protein
MTIPSSLDRARVKFCAPEQCGPGMVVLETDLLSSARCTVPFQASRWTVQPGCRSPTDSHSVHEIWMVARGNGELLYDGSTLRVAPGDIFYFEPPKAHEVLNDGPEVLEIFSVWWKHDASV